MKNECRETAISTINNFYIFVAFLTGNSPIMQFYRKKIIFIFITGLFVFLQACDDTSDCRYLENRKVKMNFVKNNKTFSDTTINDFSIIIPDMKNKELYDSIDSKTLNLSLSQNSDTSRFILKIKDVYDTITFYSTRRLEMISSECGFNTRFVVDTLTSTNNNIVSVKEVNASIDKDVLNNYLIVMKTAVVVQDTVK